MHNTALELNLQQFCKTSYTFFARFTRGGWTPHMKGVGMLVVSLRGCNFRILVLLRVFWAKRYHI